MRDVVDGQQHVSVDALHAGAAFTKRADERVIDRRGGNELVLRLTARQLFDASGRGNFAAAKNGYAIAGQLDLGQEMRVEQDGCSVRGSLAAQDVADLAAADRIDAVGRFIKQ